MRSCGIHLRAISQKFSRDFFFDMTLEVINLRLQPYHPGVNEFNILLIPPHIGTWMCLLQRQKVSLYGFHGNPAIRSACPLAVRCPVYTSLINHLASGSMVLRGHTAHMAPTTLHIWHAMPPQQVRCQGWGLLRQFSPFCYFPKFSEWSKQCLAAWYHVHIWQVSPQLSCGDTWQIWMWLKVSILYFR